MKVSFLRARRVAIAALLRAEKRRQQEREAEAAFYYEEAAKQSHPACVVSYVRIFVLRELLRYTRLQDKIKEN